MTKYQNDDERVIPRRHINGAPYNPRKIGRDQMRRLKAHIKKYGLQGTVVVNERLDENGWHSDEGFYLVSGHQRLAVLDALEGSDAYEVRCSVMHLSPKEEMENNSHFNAPGSQGEFDVTKLIEFFETPEIDIDAAGWDPLSLEDMGYVQTELTAEETSADVQDMAAQVAEIAEQSRKTAQEAREAKAKYREEQRAKDPGADFMVHFVFPNSKRAHEVRQMLDARDFKRAGEYYNGETLVDALGLGDGNE